MHSRSVGTLSPLYQLRVLVAITRKRLLQEWAYKADFLTWFVAPFLSILPFIFQARFYSGPADTGRLFFARWAGTAEYVGFIATGAAMYLWVTNILWEIGFSFRDEQVEGTLEELWLTPVPRGLLVLGNSIAHTVINSVTTFIILLLVRAFFGVSFKVNWTLFALVVVLSWSALYGLGFVYSGLVMLLKESQSLVSMGNELHMLLAGVTFPLSVLPVWIRGFSRLTPLAWVLTTLRAVILEGASWGDLGTEIAVLSTMAAVIPMVGYAGFLVFERLTRKRGTVGTY